MGKRVPTLPDTNTLMAMGYNENGVKTGCSTIDGWLHDEIKKNLRVMDEQQFIHRYKWHNLPKGLSQELIERILYYRGTGVLFYSIEMEQFYFLPYANTREIDCYGRFTEANPLPFTGTSDVKKDGKTKYWMPGLTLKQQYELCQGVEDIEDITGICIPLFDYTKQLSQNIIPRQQLSEAILDLEADFIPYMKTALMNSTGVTGVQVGSEDEQADVQLASLAIDRAAKNQQKYIPFVGAGLKFQNLTTDNVAHSEEFLIAMQSIDNFRKMLIGLGEGNLFQTKAHMLQSQMDMASTGVSMQYQDGLYQRQNFCNIVNSFFPIGMWCDEGETATGFDKDMDGIADDEVDQEGIGNEVQKEEGEVADV